MICSNRYPSLFPFNDNVFIDDIYEPGDGFFERFPDWALDVLYNVSPQTIDAATGFLIDFQDKQAPTLGCKLLFSDIACLFNDYEDESCFESHFVVTTKGLIFGIEETSYTKVLSMIKPVTDNVSGKTVMDRILYVLNNFANGEFLTGRFIAALSRVGLRNEFYVIDYLADHKFIKFPNGRVKLVSPVFDVDLLTAHKASFRQHYYLNDEN